MVKILAQKEGQETVKVSVVLSKALNRTIRHRAADNDRSAAAEIRVALEKEYGKEEKKRS
jgi:hypothetical protein